jgi:23S rRNA pseudouridine2605 synthase
MRINQYLARASGLSRRAADEAIRAGRVRRNGKAATLGDQVSSGDQISLDNTPMELPAISTIMLHKPTGYVTSRRQQGRTPTIYALLPPNLHNLKPIGRLDADSSGLLLLTNDGALAQSLQHPSSGKTKHYEVRLQRQLQPGDAEHLRQGVELEDGPSSMEVTIHPGYVAVDLHEGRNRQIRRSFGALGYSVRKLHRTSFGPYELGNLEAGRWRELSLEKVSDELA